MVRKRSRTRWFQPLTIGAFAFLVAVSLVVARDAINRRRRALARAEIAALRTSLDRYYIDNGYYPTTNQGLDSLTNQNEIDPGMIRPLVPPFHAPRDPWGRPFVYESDGNSYFLRSLGPNPSENDSDLTVYGNP
jgi:general secretion pathway protein G